MTDPALDDAIRTVSQEAAGALSIRIVFQEDLRQLIADVVIGKPEAVRLLPLVRQAMRQIRKAPRRAPALCGCCPRPIRTRFTLAVVLPERDDPTRGIAIGLCKKCTDGRDLMQTHEKAAQALRTIWPNGRLATITHRTGGRA
jgi:hypothetical protein